MMKISKGKEDMKSLGIYVHVPFCRSKCLYCGFYSKPFISDDEERLYVASVLSRIEKYSEKYGTDHFVDTIFFGGGTPSILKAESIDNIIRKLTECFRVDEDAEITVEANPESITYCKLNQYIDSGVNRLSIGAQSFDDEILKRIGRRHRSEDVLNGVSRGYEAGFSNINLDLMFGLCGQSMESWVKSIEKAIELNVEHISFYDLQIEEDTKFYHMLRKGELILPDEDTNRLMYHRCIDMLKKAGYEHYEISNCSKKGLYCKHNLKYWNLDDYLGLGPSASSYVNGERFKEGMDWSSLEYEEYHVNSASDNASEYAFTSLRTSKGIDMERFKIIAGSDFMSYYKSQESEIRKHIEAGNLIYDGTSLKLTEKGIDISNIIMAILV